MSAMDQEEKVTLPEPPKPPEKPELPEEGFVPYCGSGEEKAESASNLKKNLLIIVIGVIVVCAGLLLIGKLFGFYEKTMKNLRFDYRTGEAVAEDDLLEKGACAKALAAEIGNKQVHIDAVVYLLDEKGESLNTASRIDYLHNVNTDKLKMRTGTAGSLLTKKATVEVKVSNGLPVSDTHSGKPLLNELFFGTKSHDRITISCHNACRSAIGGKQYTCEIWLLCDEGQAKPVYYTLYRYYSGGTLYGVRILSSQDSVMEVYDLQSYTVG